MNFITTNQEENIITAKAVLSDLGILNVSFSGYSNTNGVSVYFKNENGLKFRVSDHSTSNRDRMNDECQVFFDQKLIGLGGKTSENSKFQINKLMVKRFGF